MRIDHDVLNCRRSPFYQSNSMDLPGYYGRLDFNGYAYKALERQCLRCVEYRFTQYSKFVVPSSYKPLTKRKFR